MIDAFRRGLQKIFFKQALASEFIFYIRDNKTGCEIPVYAHNWADVADKLWEENKKDK